MSSVESQKGPITIQRCSVKNQKGAITTDSVHHVVQWQWHSALLVLNGTSLNIDSALLTLNGTSLNIDSALLTLNWRCTNIIIVQLLLICVQACFRLAFSSHLCHLSVYSVIILKHHSALNSSISCISRRQYSMKLRNIVNSGWSLSCKSFVNIVICFDFLIKHT